MEKKIIVEFTEKEADLVKDALECDITSKESWLDLLGKGNPNSERIVDVLRDTQDALKKVKRASE